MLILKEKSCLPVKIMAQAQRISFPLNTKQTPLFWHIFVGHGATDAAVVVIAVVVNIVVVARVVSWVWQNEPIERIQYFYLQ